VEKSAALSFSKWRLNVQMRNMSKKTWKLRVWNRMTEMQKLDILLKHAKVPHTYDPKYLSDYTEQIVVYNSEGQRMWDAICFHGTFSLPGSYGAEQGLIEVMGAQLLGHDDVKGWLTARQVTKMWRCRNAAQNR
jgi:hypothetical protein